MKKIKKIGLAFIATLGAFSLASCSSYQTIVRIAEDVEVSQISSKITEVYARVESGCVGIDTDMGSGSGVIYKQDKATYYVVTNAHVVSDATTIKITTGGINYYNATLIGCDETNDVACLKFDLDLLNEDFYVNDIFNYEDVNQPVVGETVLAIGCPLGTSNYNVLTTGVISSVSKTEISTDAALNPGNSGGGLFNMEGRLIGLNYKKETYTAQKENGETQYIAVEGRGYVIPLSIVKSCITAIEKYENDVERPLLGIQVYSFNRYLVDVYKDIQGFVDYSKYLPDGVNFGLVVTAFTEEIPYAKNAGVLIHDVILKINDVEITSTIDVTYELHTITMEDTVKLTIYRIVDDNPTTVELTVSFN